MEVNYDDINKLQWQDVPIRSIQSISDENKRREYANRIRFCYRRFINPLYALIKLRNFDFSVSDEELTCKIMLYEIGTQLYKQGYTYEDLKDEVMGKKK